MMAVGRIMGLDVGYKRIGIALSDLLMLTAQGKETYQRRELQADLDYLAQTAKENNVVKFVCGLPKNMNGTLGEQAEKTQEFADALSEHTGIPVEFFDERLTSASAHKTLLEADMSRKKRKQVVDKLAAVYILQGYMDAHR